MAEEDSLPQVASPDAEQAQAAPRDDAYDADDAPEAPAPADDRPPRLWNEVVERSVLGWMLYNGTIPEEAASLSPQDFGVDRHKLIFRIMQRFVAERTEITIESLLTRLARDPEGARDTGWRGLLTQCDSESASILDGPELIKHMQFLHGKRKQLMDARDRTMEAFNLTVPLRPEFEPVQRILAPRFKFITAADILRPPPPVEWLVDGLIPRASLSMFYGEAGCKKTTSMLWLAVCLVTGHDWLGRKTRKSRVLFIDEELGAEWMWRRAHEAMRGVLGDDSAPLTVLSGAGLRLDQPGDMAQLQRMIELDHHEAVFIDTLAAASGGDENSKQEQQPIMSGMRQIAESTRAALSMDHHANKTGGYRGTSAFKASVDLLVKLSSAPDSDFVQFKTEKVRHGPPAQWAARVTRVEAAQQFYMEEVGMPERSHGKERPPSASKEFVLGFLRENGESSLPEITSAADICSAAAARSAVFRLARDGLICRTNAGEKGRGAASRYALVSSEDE